MNRLRRLPLYEGEGLSMKRKSIGCLVVLLGSVCLLASADKADAAKPDKLIRVTLECEDEFGIVPLYSFGADVVNFSGRGDLKKAPTRISFGCLPGAVVCVTGKGFESDYAFLTVSPEDDGKSVRLGFGTNSVR
jgi:hypothetical protein